MADQLSWDDAQKSAPKAGGLSWDAAQSDASPKSADQKVDLTDLLSLKPFGDVPKDIAADYAEGQQEFGEGLNSVLTNTSYPGAAKGLWKMLLGTAQIAGSPITGAGKALIEKPITQDLRVAGVGPEASDIIGKTAAIGAETFAPGAALSRGSEVAKKFIGTEGEALKKVLSRFAQDAKAGGMTAETALSHIDEARKLGKPMTLADVGGENVKGLAGNVSRQPGPARETARSFLNKRDDGASARLTADVDKYIATGSVRQTAEALAIARSAEGKPLFEEAYRGGSMAPLEKQFEDEFNNASRVVADTSREISEKLSKVTSLRAKLATSADIYATADWRKELAETEKSLADAESRLGAAQQDKASVLERLRGAQADKSAGSPGAVWNPRIQRLLDLPIVKSGISKGLELERQNAAAEGRAMNPSEYAIVGTDKAGNPIIGKVPNMRLLASAKEGLDAILGSPGMRDELTGRLTKEGVSVDKVRRALLKELDEANPAYKTARASWAGHSDSMESLRYGRNIFSNTKLKPEDIAADVSQMTPAEIEFAKLGAADAIREKILKTGFGGDEAKAVIKSPWMKMKMRPFFKSDAEFNKFVDSVTAERTMFETRQKLIGNSLTMERAAEDYADVSLGINAAKGVGQAASGNWLGAVQSLIRVKRDLGLRNNPELNDAIAKLLFDPNISFERLYPPSIPQAPNATKQALKEAIPFAGIPKAANPQDEYRDKLVNSIAP